MRVPRDLKPDFSIEIDFQKNSDRPSRVFQTMAELVDSFEKLGKDLIHSIDATIEPVLMLEDKDFGFTKGSESRIFLAMRREYRST